MPQNPQTQIIDLTIPAATEKPAPKPIELISCLQDHIYMDDSRKFQFETQKDSKRVYSYVLNQAKIIKRLTVLDKDKYPFHLTGMSLIEVDGIVFLGWWNDGVVA